MRIAIAPARFPHETAFLDALADTVRELGHEVEKFRDAQPYLPFPDVIVRWGVKPDGRLSDGCPIYLDVAHVYVECGWLPRWHYQVSWTGINAKHHAAGAWNMRLWNPPLDLDWIKRGDGMPRGGWGYCNPHVEAYPGLAPFWLCPLQVPTDVNMDALPKPLRTPQGLVDRISAMVRYQVFPGVSCDARVYFKQHPAMSERRQTIAVPPPHKYLHHRSGQIASYLKSPQCLGVICGNSNVFHDALLWGKPAIALGDGFWGQGPVTMTPGTDECNAYLRHLLKQQWKLEDARKLTRVEMLLENATR